MLEETGQEVVAFVELSCAHKVKVGVVGLFCLGLFIFKAVVELGNDEPGFVGLFFDVVERVGQLTVE